MNTEIENVKKQDIINTAHHLFWKFGIRRVSVEEICREAGVSKMTFYKFFPNKTDLAITVMTKIFEESVKKYRDLMSENISFEEKVKKQILLKFEGTKEISQELVRDIYGGQVEGLKEFWEAKSNEMLTEILDSYRDAQEKGWIRKEVNVDFIQFYTAKLFEIVSDEKAVAFYGDIHLLIMEIINLFFYGIMPRNQAKDE